MPALGVLVSARRRPVLAQPLRDAGAGLDTMSNVSVGDGETQPPLTRLAAFRRLSHAGLARLAFVVETAAVSATGLVLLTVLVVRADPLATAHEWGSFLTHYVAAAPGARHPVDLFLLTAFAAAFAVITWIRLPAARRPRSG